MQMKSVNISQINNNLNNEKEMYELTQRGAVTSSDINNGVYKPVPPPKPLTPPYRMPPQPPLGSSIYETSIPDLPGSTLTSTDVIQNNNNVMLRTHSSKFPIERELILTSDKSSSKINKIMHECRTPSGLRRAGLQLSRAVVAPDHPKQMQAWNTQSQLSQQTQQQLQQQLQQSEIIQQSSLNGAIPRAPARLPEDVTALATERCGDSKDTNNKNAVAKTYHTLKDLISSKFKKDINETSTDGLNNVTVQQQLQQQIQLQQQLQQPEEYRSPYSALPAHMRQGQNLNQSQPNIWMGGRQQTESPRLHQMSAGIQMNGQQQQQQQQQQLNGQQQQQRNYTPAEPPRTVVQQQRAASQPQLNMPFERRGSQILLDQMDRRGSLANIDVTDSDDGGFISRARRPQTMYQLPPPPQTQQHLQQSQSPVGHLNGQQQTHSQRNSPHVFQNGSNNNQSYSPQHVELNGTGQAQYVAGYQQQQQQQQNNSMQQQQQYSSSAAGLQQQSQQYQSQQQQQLYQQQQQQQQFQTQAQIQQQQQRMAEGIFASPKIDLIKAHPDNLGQPLIQTRQDVLRSSFQKVDNQQNGHSSQTIGPSSSSGLLQKYIEQEQNHQKLELKPSQRTEIRQTTATGQELSKPVSGSAASSDYDKSGNQSSNVDSGRGSAAYSSGRKGAQIDTSPESSDSILRPKDNDTEWVDIVDAELRHILEPGMQGLSIRPESTVSGSVSSISPTLPPISPNDSNRYKQSQSKDNSKQEYGTDSYNRPGRSSGAIGPSRAGWPGSSIQKQGQSRSSAKKQEQTLLKRHLFGLDNDLTSTTTRSLDLDSLLGAPWGAGQSVSDSETDTQGLRHIRSQLEGLENMYSEVLRMLGTRNPNNRVNENHFRGGSRRRHGSLSSLPSSSVSGRPIRDRRRVDDRRKVRDIKGINKRFQRLESHVVTLARSVAHLSSEMRSQHLVTQELERLRDDLATLRAQAGRPTNGLYQNNGDPEPLNLTNPKRVKKLTKFFGEDPPLMRLFLKKLGYEKYAALFENERVGMIELPYLGEERLQKLGVPLGPRLRILQEAQISLCKDTTLCIV